MSLNEAATEYSAASAETSLRPCPRMSHAMAV